MKKLNKLLILLCFYLTACSMLDHRDFSEEMTDYRFDEPMFQANKDFMIIAGDSGRDYRSPSEIRERTPATLEMNESYIYKNSLKKELHHLQAKLTEDEYYQFQQLKPKIGGTSEQIYFLRLKPYERREYLSLRGIKKERNNYADRFKNSRRVPHHPIPASAIKGDVAFGMNMDQVIDSWGAPARRDIAGNPKYKNERWTFRKEGRTKYIYFESGVVQGWSEGE